MAVDPHAVYRNGGKDLVRFLQYCVMSVYVDPLFAFLVGEYRLQATTVRALALYDVFCHPRATARVTAAAILSPRDPRLGRHIEELRDDLARVERFNATDPELRQSVHLPAPGLFDQVEKNLMESSGSTLGIAAQRYDPVKSPTENLPGGKMNEVQLQFVNQVWQPHLRPHLVQAGFRRIANIA